MEIVNVNDNVVDTKKMNADELCKHYEKLCTFYKDIELGYKRIYLMSKDVGCFYLKHDFFDQVAEILCSDSKNMKCKIDTLCTETRDKINKIAYCCSRTQMKISDYVVDMVSYLKNDLNHEYHCVINDICDKFREEGCRLYYLVYLPNKETIDNNINDIVHGFVFFNSYDNETIYEYITILYGDVQNKSVEEIKSRTKLIDFLLFF